MGSSSGNRLPLVTLLVAILIFAGFALPGMGPEGADLGADLARQEAQEFFHRHPGVSLSARDRALVGSKYVDRVLADEASRPGGRPGVPPGLRARVQATICRPSRQGRPRLVALRTRPGATA